MTKPYAVTEILATHYAKTFAEFGANSVGVDWGSREKHQLRLRHMVQHIGVETIRDNSVLDVGCGYGELLSVLDDSFDVKPSNYRGIDPCLPLIEVARHKFPDYRFDAVALEDFISDKPLQHLLCCGVFTKKLHVADEDMYGLLDAFFAKAISLSSQTITFNTMSPLCDVRPDELFFPTLDRIMYLIRSHRGYRVQKFNFVTDYLKYEMLVHVVL